MSDRDTLPDGWVKAFDPGTGLPYYANPATGETQWEPPRRRPPPPPPPPPRRAVAAAPVHHYHQQQQQHRPYQYGAPNPNINPSGATQQNDDGAHYCTQQQQQQPLLSSSTQAASRVGYASSHFDRVPPDAEFVSEQQQQPYQQELQQQPRQDQPAAAAAPIDPDQELKSFTVGMVADLCFVQSSRAAAAVTPSGDADASSASYYAPIQASTLLAGPDERPQREKGRIETRMHSLYDQLSRMGAL